MPASKHFRCPAAPLLSLLAASALTACGGSSDPPEPHKAPAAPRIVGTVAVGAALGGAAVQVTDAGGMSACAEADLTTAADGTYACTLVEGALAPFLVVAADAEGAVAPLVSVGVRTPEVDETAVVNATPLTTAILAQLVPNDDAMALTKDRALIDVDTLTVVKAKVRAQLAAVLAAMGLPDDFDPMTATLVASAPQSEGNAADHLLKVLKISRVDGQLLVATVDRPDAAVPLADASTTSPLVVAAPGGGTVSLASAMRALATNLEACFLLPVDNRVLARDDDIPTSLGGPEVTAAAPACEDVVSPAFLSGGYRAGQAFYGLLTDEGMSGARFEVPDLMLVMDQDTAVVNFRHRRADGTLDRLIQIVRRNTDGAWRLYGNQQRVDSGIRPFIRRVQQFAPGTPAFANAPSSRFESGFSLFVNKDGPGSAGLRAARFTGPGLPPAGVVLTPPSASVCSEQYWMNVRRKDGNTAPAAATPATSGGTLFQISRTRGLSGADAVTRRPNPNEGNTDNERFVSWAHPIDYGVAPGASDYIDFKSLKAFTSYTLELFYDGEAAPRYTYEKLILSPVVPATALGTQQWTPLDEETARYLDPSDARGGQQETIRVGWIPNPLAERLSDVGVFTYGNGQLVHQGNTPVPRGAGAVEVVAPKTAACAAGATFPALTFDGTSFRQFILQHRLQDGSKKEEVFRFN